MTQKRRTPASAALARPLFSHRNAVLAVTLALAASAFFAYRLQAGEKIPLLKLVEQTHVHGIGVAPGDPETIWLATHHGFYAVDADGAAERLSDTRSDFMGFSPHPSDPSVLFASGHPQSGGNLGVIRSTDGGRSWKQIAAGANGPVDFHQMDASPADPNVLYGAYAGQLQVSRDGGESWSIVAPAPPKLIDLAASASDPGVLYAATEEGLRISRDGGQSWEPAHVLKRPATMVEVTPKGIAYAFMVGTGLLRASEPGLGWAVLSADFGEDYVMHLAANPDDPEKLYAATYKGKVLVSADGGENWSPLATGVDG